MKKLGYLNEFMLSPQGEKCRVLDVSSLDFSNAALGRKSVETLVKKARGGEIIHTYGTDGKIESTTVASCGDAIFCNSATDVYIPSSENGHWQYDKLTTYGYDIVSSGDDFCKIKSNNFALLLVSIIKEPTCIKNAFGLNNHQFLFSGATIKKDRKTNQISGISKEAFQQTWEVLSKNEKTEINF